MKVLAFELSSSAGSLAWLNGGGEPVVRTWPNDRKHSGAFFESLSAVRKQFGLPDTLVVGLGPGSYAGVRIALSTALGLATAAKARLIGLPSICAMETDAKEYCVIGDARRQSFFFARIRAREAVEGPILLEEEQLAEKLDGVDREVPVLATEKLRQCERATICFPVAMVLARLALEPDRRFALPPLEPIYLREPHITVPKMRDPTGIKS